MHFKPAILDLNSWTLLHPEMEGLISSIEGWGMKKALIKYTYRGSYQHCLVGVSHQLNWTYKSSGPSTKVAAVIFLCAHSHHLQFFEGDEKIVELNDFSLYGKPKKTLSTPLYPKRLGLPLRHLIVQGIVFGIKFLDKVLQRCQLPQWGYGVGSRILVGKGWSNETS